MKESGTEPRDGRKRKLLLKLAIVGFFALSMAGLVLSKTVFGEDDPRALLFSLVYLLGLLGASVSAFKLGQLRRGGESKENSE